MSTLQTFFFVPANNQKFIEKSKSLKTDYVIFDLEDAVLLSELCTCLENLSKLDIQNNYYIRFTFFDSLGKLDENLFDSVLKTGFNNFVIPKFMSTEQLLQIKIYLEKNNIIESNPKFILLVESPLGLLNLYKTLKQNIIPVFAVGLGSHDYANEIGMKHNQYNLYFAKQLVLNCAKAFNLLPLDTVSVNIDDDNEFEAESKLAFEMGFEGKFVIHPHQLDVIHNIDYYTEDEIAEAKKIHERILDIQSKKTALVRIDGKIYEKPHIKRIMNIINWSRKWK